MGISCTVSQTKHTPFSCHLYMTTSTKLTTTTVLQFLDYVQDYLGEPVPES